MTFDKGICTEIEILDKDGSLTLERFYKSPSQNGSLYVKNIEHTAGAMKTNEEYFFNDDGNLAHYKKAATNSDISAKEKVDKLFLYNDDGNLIEAIYGMDKDNNSISELCTKTEYYKNLTIPETNFIPLVNVFELQNGLGFEEKYIFKPSNGDIKPVEYLKGYKVEQDKAKIDEAHGFLNNGYSYGFKNKVYEITERDKYNSPKKVKISNVESGYMTTENQLAVKGNMFIEGDNKTYLFKKTTKNILLEKRRIHL